MKVLTFSRQFPKGHPKAGQPTHFPEKIMAGLADSQVDYKIPDDFVLWEWLPYYNCRQPKFHTIRAGNRFKPGDMASLRVWSDKAYRSKQIEFAQVEVKKTWEFRLRTVNENPIGDYCITINNQLSTLTTPLSDIMAKLASNDGLSIEDFISWFAIHPKRKGLEFCGQIISWNDKIEY